MKPEKDSYIEVTQDGIVRIMSDTATNLQGIYTEGLETCLAFIVVGKNRKSLSMIHATNKLSPDSLKNEFKLHGEIEFWTIAYNPTRYPKKIYDEQLQLRLARFIEEIEEVAKGKVLKKEGVLHFYEAKKGFVYVNRNGVIEINNKPMNIISPKNKELRHNINIVNNYFLTGDATDVVDADIQYDGRNFLDLPNLKKSDKEIEMLSKELKFINSSSLLMVIKLRNDVKKQISAHKLKEQGNQSFKKKEYQSALDFYDRALSLNPEFKVAWLNKSKAFFHLSKINSAILSAEKALEIDPSYKDATSVLNNLLRVKGDNKKNTSPSGLFKIKPPAETGSLKIETKNKHFQSKK